MEIQESKQIQLITDIKDKIKAAQYRALLNVNEQLIRLYWDIGNDLMKILHTETSLLILWRRKLNWPFRR